MNHLKYELLGIIGFFISGIIFIIAGIRSGDLLSITGSVIWTSACVLWMVPLLSRLKDGRDGGKPSRQRDFPVCSGLCAMHLDSGADFRAGSGIHWNLSRIEYRGTGCEERPGNRTVSPLDRIRWNRSWPPSKKYDAMGASYQSSVNGKHCF